MACRRTGNAVSDQRWNARRKIERGGGCGARTANARLTHGLGGSLGEALTLREACQLSGAVEMQREAQSLALSVHGPDTQAQHRQRSEEHTSELQSRVDLVCRLLLEKKKKKKPQ